MHREIETKLSTLASFEDVQHCLNDLFFSAHRKHGQSTDYYFKAAEGFDFIRIRNEGINSTVCGKLKDRGTNSNRLEAEFQTLDPEGAVALFRRLLGGESAVIKKTYTEYVFPLIGMIVSCCSTNLNGKVIIEVEGLDDVLRGNLVAAIQRELETKTETQSLFEMAMEKYG